MLQALKLRLFGTSHTSQLWTYALGVQDIYTYHLAWKACCFWAYGFGLIWSLSFLERLLFLYTLIMSFLQILKSLL